MGGVLLPLCVPGNPGWRPDRMSVTLLGEGNFCIPVAFLFIYFIFLIFSFYFQITVYIYFSQFLNYFIVVQLQLSAFSPHLSTPIQPNPPPSKSTLLISVNII